jgi:RHS repeat-associated protein
MDNTLYNPSPQTGSYSTQYTYDDAGNILTLKRRGLVPPLSSPPVYGAIDDLTYNYNDPLNPQEKSRLQSITDAIMDPNAQPEGFKGNQNPGDTIPDKASTFKYDDNGNLIYDGGKELTIDYNFLNLPRLVNHSGSGNSIQLDYTFGGEKIKKVSPEGTRIYLGGVEYLDNSPESLTHSDGRVDLSGAGGPKHQFSIKDHLGNTVVLFEDANNDGAVFSSEVLQRNLYYPFGLELKGEWNSATSPRMDYLYNGKEFNEELELNWLDYGFRWYDPAVGRFPSVDPLAADFASVSPYVYVLNNPIKLIDPLGLAPSEPPIDGLSFFSDDTGDYYWNERKGSYDHHDKITGDYIDQYNVPTDYMGDWKGPQGEYFIVFDEDSPNPLAPDIEYNSAHTPFIAKWMYGVAKESGTMTEITDQNQYPGVRIFSLQNLGDAAVTLGNFIFVDGGFLKRQERSDGSNSLIEHEYGHFLDFTYHFNSSGYKYLYHIGIPSIGSAAGTGTYGKDHSENPAEQRADILSESYFKNK